MIPLRFGISHRGSDPRRKSVRISREAETPIVTLAYVALPRPKGRVIGVRCEGGKSGLPMEAIGPWRDSNVAMSLAIGPGPEGMFQPISSGRGAG